MVTRACQFLRPLFSSASPAWIHIWRPDETLVRTLRTQQTGGKFLNVAWSPDGSLILAGAVDYGIWRSDGTPVAHLWPGGSPVWSLAWSPDGSHLAGGSDGGDVCVWHVGG